MKMKIPSLLWETIVHKDPVRACKILYPKYCPFLLKSVESCGECQTILFREIKGKSKIEDIKENNLEL